MTLFSRRLTARRAPHRLLMTSAVALAAVVGVGGGAMAFTATSVPVLTSATAPAGPSATGSTDQGSSASAKVSGAKASGANASGAKALASKGRRPAALSMLSRLAERAVHVQVVVRTRSGYVTFTGDRGTIVSISPSSVTLSEADGQRVTDTVSSATHVVPAALGGISALHDGDRVVVVAKNAAATTIWLPSAHAHVVRATLTSISPTTLTLTNAKGKVLDLSIVAKTRVLPASVGGLSGLHDGQRLAVRDLAGTAQTIRVLGTHGATPAASSHS